MAQIADRCPICRTEPVHLVPWADEEDVADAGDAALGAKAAALLEIVEGSAKDASIVVFSQFTSFLRFLELELRSKGVPLVRIDGSMTLQERRSSMASFQARSVRVALCGLKAVGAGVTLTAGSTVVLCDPWWSPAVEAQAVDRCHRIGQRRPVEVVRLVAARSVEEKIRAIQSQKRGIMEGLHRSREELQATRVEMVMKLFSGPWVRQKRPGATGDGEAPAKRPRRAAAPKGRPKAKARAGADSE